MSHSRARTSVNKLVSMSLEDLAPTVEGVIDAAGLRSSSAKIGKLVKKGFKIIAVVGGGSLGEDYSRISIRFSKEKKGATEIKHKAAVANSLLLIAALKNLGVAVNSAPVTDLKKIDQFLSTRFWSVAAIANQGDQKSTRLTSQLAKKYHAMQIHLVNTKKIIDNTI